MFIVNNQETKTNANLDLYKGTPGLGFSLSLNINVLKIQLRIFTL